MKRISAIRTGCFLLVLPLVILMIEGCGIKKMIKDAGKVTYEVTPNPLELHGDSVKITVNGVFPQKYFHKKATVTVTPVVKYNGGEKALKSVVLRGDKVEGGGEAISFKEGGKFTLKDQFLFVKGMEKAEVVLRASAVYKGKTKDLPEVKIADGTIITPLLLKPDYKTVAAGDKFDKNPTVTQKSNLYFLVDSWDVRPVEMKSDEMSNMFRFVDKAAKDSSEFVKMDIYGYASPEGELKRNAMLSDNRAEAANKVMNDRFKKAKLKDLAKREGFYNKITSNYEDWDGLKGMLQSSSIDGKEKALSIINTVGDPEAREAQFRQLASYDPIYEAYFPKLRRAEINLAARLRTRTDDQIRALSASSPDSLGMEELLYSSTLVSTPEERFKIYQAYARRFPDDYRGFNNMGVVYVQQGKVNEAQSEFEKANRIASNNPIVQNNLGVVAAIKGDRKNAATLFAAGGNSPEGAYNKGNLSVASGKYSDAVSSYGNECSYNSALAKVLAGNYSGATQTLDCSADKESAEGHYLRAVIAARGSQKEAVVSNLTKAIAANASLKERARNDQEFRKYSAELSGMLN